MNFGASPVRDLAPEVLARCITIFPVVAVRARSGWRIRRARPGLRGTGASGGPVIAVLAMQFGPERLGTSLGSRHPGAIDPRRIVPNVLVWPHSSSATQCPSSSV